MTLYMNVDTGELFTEREVLADWHDNYDGWDETNLIDFSAQYKEVEVNG